MAIMHEDNSVVGTKFKLIIKMEPIGSYHLADLDWEAKIFVENGNKSAMVTKADARQVDQDSYIIPVDSRVVGPGKYFLTLSALIPDGDFPDGTRTEVKTTATGVTINPK